MQNTIMSDTMQDFLSMVKKVYENNVGYETYGDVTEFYDEDGVVLMTMQEVPGGKMRFAFDNGEVFDMNEVA